MTHPQFSLTIRGFVRGGVTKEANFFSNRVLPWVRNAFSRAPKPAFTGTPGFNPFSAGAKAVPNAAAAPAAAAAAAPVRKAHNTFGHITWNALRGATGFGPSENATSLAKGVSYGSGAMMMGMPLAMGMLGRPDRSPTQGQQQMMTVTASAAEPLYRVKTSGVADRVRAGVDLASYGALAIPTALRAISPKTYDANAGIMHALDAAGLTGLGATSLYGLATEPNKAPDALDAAGLAMMGAALHRRTQDH